MQPIIYVFIGIIALIVLICLVILIRYLTHKKYISFVLQNSVCLKRLNEINQRYSFYPHISFDQSHTYDNEKYYETISCKDYLIYQLQYISKKVFNQMHKVKTNKQLYSNYLNEIKSLENFGQFQTSAGKLKLDKLIKYEQRQIEKQTYRIPTTEFNLTVTLFCSTINGRVYNKKCKQFTAEDIYFLNKRLNNKNGDFYNDREIWDALCRVERGKVSNKMRFSIYERDGYKCCKCGISKRYAKLEIDHIIPIAKGGKTTYDNLQTLCHKCNVEKGDTLL